MNFDFNSIYDFCKVRNLGNATKNGTEDYPPRVKFLLELIEKHNIPYEVDTYPIKGSNLHNIYLKGTSDKWVMAHHDVCNHRIDNANDNSASVINAIALKTIRPDINIALVDGEEPPLMGAGSTRFADLYKDGKLNVNWVLNLELSGVGGENFFIGNYNTDLTKKIKDKFECAVMNVPFNDAAILIQQAGINAALINPCPLIKSFKVTSVSDKGLEFLQSSNKNHIDKLQKYLDRINKAIEKYKNDEEILTDYKIDKYELEKEIDEVINSSKLHVGSIISQEIYNKLSRDRVLNEFGLEEITTEIKGRMPFLKEMDTSILHRCHTSDDVVEHLSTSDMKDFVTRVLTVICDIS